MLAVLVLASQSNSGIRWFKDSSHWKYFILGMKQSQIQI